MNRMVHALPQAQMWRLSPDSRTIRLQLPPIQFAGIRQSIDIHLDFEAEAVDEILQRLTELRTQMEPPPIRQ